MRGAIRSNLEVLKAIPLFKACSNRELAAVDSLVAEDRASAGEVIVREGRPGREAFIVLSGEAAVTASGVTVGRLGVGDFFGEMALLGDCPERVATVTAITPMRLLVIDPRQFASLLEMEGVAREMLKEVADRLGAVLPRSA